MLIPMPCLGGWFGFVYLIWLPLALIVKCVYCVWLFLVFLLWICGLLFVEFRFNVLLMCYDWWLWLFMLTVYGFDLMLVDFGCLIMVIVDFVWILCCSVYCYSCFRYLMLFGSCAFLFLTFTWQVVCVDLSLVWDLLFVFSY